MPRQRRTTTRITTLRTETQRQRMLRMMFQGWSTKRIAKALHCSADTVRDLKGTVEFQTLYATYEREQLDRMDRRLVAMYSEGLDALRRQLRDRDWRARDAALEKLFRFSSDVRGRVAPAGSAQQGWWQSPMDDMTDDQRTLARQLMKAMRPTSPSRLLRNHPPGDAEASSE